MLCVCVCEEQRNVYKGTAKILILGGKDSRAHLWHLHFTHHGLITTFSLRLTLNRTLRPPREPAVTFSISTNMKTQGIALATDLHPL